MTDPAEMNNAFAVFLVILVGVLGLLCLRMWGQVQDARFQTRVAEDSARLDRLRARNAQALVNRLAAPAPPPEWTTYALPERPAIEAAPLVRRQGTNELGPIAFPSPPAIDAAAWTAEMPAVMPEPTLIDPTEMPPAPYERTS